jgi:cell wall-associated NlpC family hydrolase
MSRAPSRASLRVRVTVVAASLFTCLGLAVAPGFASSAAAGPTTTATSTWTPVDGTVVSDTTSKPSIDKIHNEEVRKVLREARRQKGKPYVYGEDGPHGFDCSGLVRFVFLHAVHKVLPHNAAAQYHSLRHIRRSILQPGDLVFVDNGGYISHVGIYDGHHHWWVAPHTGTRVQRQRIYHAHFLYARVLVYHKTLPRKHKG